MQTKCGDGDIGLRARKWLADIEHDEPSTFWGIHCSISDDKSEAGATRGQPAFPHPNPAGDGGDREEVRTAGEGAQRRNERRKESIGRRSKLTSRAR